MPEYSIESVLQIRQFLTEVLVNHGTGSELAGHLRAMRAACRVFLDRLHRWIHRYLEHPEDGISFEDLLHHWRLNNELQRVALLLTHPSSGAHHPRSEELLGKRGCTHGRHGSTSLQTAIGQALGELRTVFGFQIAQIAARYSLDVEEPLSYTIHAALPPAQDDEE